MPQQIDTSKKPREILGQLIRSNLNPLQEEGLKSLAKAQDQQIQEAVQKGVPVQDIAKQLKIPDSKQQAEQVQQPSVNQALTGQVVQQPQQTQIPEIPSFLGFKQAPSVRGQVLRNIQTEQAIRGETPIQQKDINAAVLKAQLDTTKELAKAGQLTANNIFTKFEPVANNFQGIIDSFARVQASIEDPSAAGDLALVFNFMKILDPNSVVRESEFATAENSAGVPDRIRNVFNRIQRGERMAPAQRKDFSGRARKLFKSKEKQFKRTESEFKRIARKNRIDPSAVIRQVGLVEGNGSLQAMSDEQLRAIAGGQ